MSGSKNVNVTGQVWRTKDGAGGEMEKITRNKLVFHTSLSKIGDKRDYHRAPVKTRWGLTTFTWMLQQWMRRIFFSRMVTGDETWIHPESKDYGVETYWLARNKESKTQSSTRKMMLIVFDDSLYWKTIWSEQFARNVEESVLVVWQYTPIYGRSNRSNWILRYRHTSPTAHISRLPAITSLDGSKMLYKIVDFLWIKKSKNRCFLEGIRNVVEHWNKRIEKEWDYVENGCTCLTDAFV